MSAQPKLINGAIQLFDKGLMVWRSDTDYIWALVDSGLALGFPSADYSRLPDNPHKELDRLMPENGFGKVWGNNFRVRDALGFARLLERPASLSVWSIEGTTYLEQPDKTIIQIDADNTWSQGPATVPPPAPLPPPTPPAPPPTGEYVTVAEYQAGMEKLRSDLMAYMTKILNAHIDRSLTLEEVMDEASRRLKTPPVMSAQLLKSKAS